MESLVTPVVHEPCWALVLGGAGCVWEDVCMVVAMLGAKWPGIVVAANDIGCHWPERLEQWATVHPEKMPGWAADRKTHGFSPAVTWTRVGGSRRQQNTSCADHVIQPWGGGSSGMLAVQVAREVGCTHAILCGLPMTKTEHFVQSTVHVLHRPWSQCDNHWRVWPRLKNKMLPWARSMSGRTRELLGMPTAEWLNTTLLLPSPVLEVAHGTT